MDGATHPAASEQTMNRYIVQVQNGAHTHASTLDEARRVAARQSRGPSSSGGGWAAAAAQVEIREVVGADRVLVEEWFDGRATAEAV